MKENRVGLTGKLFLFCFLSVLACMMFLISMITYTMQKTAVEEVYYRLNNYCDVTADFWQNGIPINPKNKKNYSILQGLYNNGDLNITHESNFDEILGVEITSFYEDLEVGDHTYVTKDGRTYYYSFKISQKNDNFIVMLVSDTYSQDFISRIVLNIGLTIILSILILGILLSFFMRSFIKRISLLNQHINNMIKNDYKVSYNDKISNDELSELADSIEAMRKEIESSEHTKNEMLQNISHDLKTPIAVIKNYAESIIDGFDTESSAEVIVKQADVLISKVNQLLQYNKLEYLSKDKEFENINLKEVCQDVINNLGKNSNIEFVSKLEDCYFLGYKENFYTVISNIVDNALRYAKTKIIITTKKDKVTIYNDGESISEQFVKGEFKPYEKGSQGQFGLGMSIVTRTLYFFNLDLKVYNETYGGVSFVISKNN